MTDHAKLLKAIKARRAGDEPGTITTRELRGMTGFCENKALDIIRDLVSAGKLKPDMIRRTNMHGISSLVMGYRIAA